MAKSSSLGQLAGLLIATVLVLAATGLFGIWSAHHRGAEALQVANRLTKLADSAREAQVDFKIQVQLWKNLLLRGQNADDFRDYRDKFQQQQKKVQADLDAVLASPNLPAALQAELASMKDTHAKMDETYATAANAYVTGDPSSIFRVDASVRGIDQKLNERFDNVAAGLDQDRNDQVVALQANDEQQYGQLELIIGIISGLTVLIVIIVGFKITTLSSRV